MSHCDSRPEKIRLALQVLELPPEATAAEVRQAYRFLRDLYGTESIATLPISGEMSPEEQKEIADSIETAYKTVLQYFESERQKGPQHLRAAPADVRDFLSRVEAITGPVLKSVRELSGYGIEEVAAETRIPVLHLNNIEAEAFDALPPPVYTRGFIFGYAGFLDLDAERATADFMSRFNRWEKAIADRPSKKRFRLAFWRKDR